MTLFSSDYRHFECLNQYALYLFNRGMQLKVSFDLLKLIKTLARFRDYIVDVPQHACIITFCVFINHDQLWSDFVIISVVSGHKSFGILCCM